MKTKKQNSQKSKAKTLAQPSKEELKKIQKATKPLNKKLLEEDDDEDFEDEEEELDIEDEGEFGEDYDEEELNEEEKAFLNGDGGDLEGDDDELEGDDEELEEGEFDEDGEFDEEGDEEGMPMGPPGFIRGPDPDSEDEVDYAEDDKPKERSNLTADVALLSMKIDELLKILVRFKELRDPERSRQSYLDELKGLFQQYYGYNEELIETFMRIFSPGECAQFLESNEKPKPSTIRTNTLKTNRRHLAQILIQRGVTLEPLAEWSKVGIKIFESRVTIGATPEYLAGHYMLQSASSFLPVIAMAPQPGERVLDMAAAPGGKTSYICQLMKNTGIVVANDAKAERLKSLKFNIQRLGITNCIVCNYDGRKFTKVMKGFDRVLLDAPCTGLGIIAKDPSVKTSRMYIDIKKMSHLQKELILSAIDCCKVGGHIVYSTCSITVEENEWVLDYALKNRNIKIVDSEIEIGEEGITKYMDKRFDPNVKKSRRIYPHVHNMDGFFVAKIKKIANGSPKVPEEQKSSDKKKNKKNKNKAQNKAINDEREEEEVIGNAEDFDEEIVDEDEEEEEEQEEEEIIPEPPKNKKNANKKGGQQQQKGNQQKKDNKKKPQEVASPVPAKKPTTLFSKNKGGSNPIVDKIKNKIAEQKHQDSGSKQNASKQTGKKEFKSALEKRKSDKPNIKVVQEEVIDEPEDEGVPQKQNKKKFNKNDGGKNNKFNKKQGKQNQNNKGFTKNKKVKK